MLRGRHGWYHRLLPRRNPCIFGCYAFLKASGATVTCFLSTMDILCTAMVLAIRLLISNGLTSQINRQPDPLGLDDKRPNNSALYQVHDLCLLPFDPGLPTATVDPVKRWYYDAGLGQCIQFMFSPHAANSNNFLTKEDCERVCGGGFPIPSAGSSSPSLSVFHSSDNCTEEVLTRLVACQRNMAIVMTPFLNISNGWFQFCDPNHTNISSPSAYFLDSIWRSTCNNFAKVDHLDACKDVHLCDYGGEHAAGQALLSFLCQRRLFDSLKVDSRTRCLDQLRRDPKALDCPSLQQDCRSNAANCCKLVTDRITCLEEPVRRLCGDEYWSDAMQLNGHMSKVKGEMCQVDQTIFQQSIDEEPFTKDDLESGRPKLDPRPPGNQTLELGVGAQHLGPMTTATAAAAATTITTAEATTTAAAATTTTTYQNGSFNKTCMYLFWKWTQTLLLKNSSLCTGHAAFKNAIENTTALNNWGTSGLDASNTTESGNFNITSFDDINMTECHVSMKIIENLLHERCNDTDTSPNLSLSCLSKLSASSKLGHCLATLLRGDFNFTLKGDTDDKFALRRGACRFLDTFFSCAASLAEEACGSEMAGFLNGTIDRVRKWNNSLCLRLEEATIQKLPDPSIKFAGSISPNVDAESVKVVSSEFDIDAEDCRAQNATCHQTFQLQLQTRIQNLTSAVFDIGSLCQSYLQYQNCLICLKLSLDPTVEDAFGYLCDRKGQMTISSVQHCFVSVMNDLDTIRCVDGVSAEGDPVGDASSKDSTMNSPPSLCHQSDLFLTCIRIQLIAKCGTNAYNFVKSMYQRLIGVLEPSCQDSPEDDTLPRTETYAFNPSFQSDRLKPSFKLVAASNCPTLGSILDQIRVQVVNASATSICEILQQSFNSSLSESTCKLTAAAGYENLQNHICRPDQNKPLERTVACLNRLDHGFDVLERCVDTAREDYTCSSGQKFVDCAVGYVRPCGETVAQFILTVLSEFYSGINCSLQLPPPDSNSTCGPEDQAVAMYCAGNLTLTWEPLLLMANMDDYQRYCKNTATYQNCISSRNRCAPKTLNGLIDLASYYCDQDKSSINRTCLVYVIGTPTVRDCLAIFESTIGSTGSSLCDSIAALMQCLSVPLVYTCGRETFIDLLKAHNRLLEVIDPGCAFPLPPPTTGWCTMSELNSVQLCDEAAHSAMKSILNIEEGNQSLDDDDLGRNWILLTSMCQNLSIHSQCVSSYPCRTNASSILDDIYRRRCSSIVSLDQQITQCFMQTLKHQRAVACAHLFPPSIQGGFVESAFPSMGCDEFRPLFNCMINASLGVCDNDTWNLLNVTYHQLSPVDTHCFSEPRQLKTDPMFLAVWQAQTLRNGPVEIEDPIFARALNNTCLIDVLNDSRVIQSCSPFMNIDSQSFICSQDQFFQCSERIGIELCGVALWSATKLRLSRWVTDGVITCNGTFEVDFPIETSGGTDQYSHVSTSSLLLASSPRPLVFEDCLNRIVQTQTILDSCGPLLPESVAMMTMNGQVHDQDPASFASFACANARFFRCASIVLHDVCSEEDWTALKSQINQILNEREIECAPGNSPGAMPGGGPAEHGPPETVFYTYQSPTESINNEVIPESRKAHFTLPRENKVANVRILEPVGNSTSGKGPGDSRKNSFEQTVQRFEETRKANYTDTAGTGGYG